LRELMLNDRVCPLDYRYGSNEMKEIFSEDQKLKLMLRVEGALAEAQGELGVIPKGASEEIAKGAKRVKLQRIKEVEKTTGHDVMAIVQTLSECCKEVGDVGWRYVHLGATSNDIIDSATALQIKEALGLIELGLEGLISEIKKLAGKHKSTVMIGRTHGQHALPITFGLKMAVFGSEMQRHLERLREGRDRITVGKMSGAVGTGASFGDRSLELKKLVMGKLGIREELFSTQIVGRDRYAELIYILSIIATSLEKLATEIRNLQRNEIGEVSEKFRKGQVGSSTMVQKKNPVTCEQVCGLARVVRSNLNVALEDMVLWHERDLTNSSAERFIIPHAFILADHIINRMAHVLNNLAVNEERMRANLLGAKGIMGERIALFLVGKELGRQDAYGLVKDCISSGNFDPLLGYMSREELDDLLNPLTYLGKSEELIEKFIKS